MQLAILDADADDVDGGVWMDPDSELPFLCSCRITFKLLGWQKSLKEVSSESWWKINNLTEKLAVQMQKYTQISVKVSSN